MRSTGRWATAILVLLFAYLSHAGDLISLEQRLAQKQKRAPETTSLHEMRRRADALADLLDHANRIQNLAPATDQATLTVREYEAHLTLERLHRQAAELFEQTLELAQNAEGEADLEAFKQTMTGFRLIGIGALGLATGAAFYTDDFGLVKDLGPGISLLLLPAEKIFRQLDTFMTRNRLLKAFARQLKLRGYAIPRGARHCEVRFIQKHDP